MAEAGKLIEAIYDCAVDPGLWPKTLTQIRDQFDAAYVMTSFVEAWPNAMHQPVNLVRRTSPWDDHWFDLLGQQLHLIKGQDVFARSEIDEAWTQLSQGHEIELRETEFFERWVKPQGLRDCLNIHFLKRPGTIGVMSIASAVGRAPLSVQEQQLAEALTPHIRRSIAINDIVDKGNLALAIYKKLLDQIRAAVLVLDRNSRLILANGSGDVMLNADQYFNYHQGIVSPKINHGNPFAFAEAVYKAAQGDAFAGVSGIGVPLMDAKANRIAAFVLPLSGKHLRAELGKGYAAVFIAQGHEQQPVLIEILRTLYNLTSAEARTVAALAQGQGPITIAENSGLSVNTVRSYLSKAFEKTRTSDQTELCALVNNLMPAVAV